MPDLYVTLGVPRDADTAAIRKAYRKASKRAHPDGGGSPEKFRSVKQALDVLSDAGRRKAYDQTGTIEDKPVDNSESELMGIVSALLDAVLQGLDQQGIPFEAADLVQRMAQAAVERQTQIQQQRNNLKKGIAAQGKLLKRFKKKNTKDGQENRMERLMIGRIAFLEGQDSVAQSHIDQMRKAELFIREYKFESDEMPRAAGYVVMRF